MVLTSFATHLEKEPAYLLDSGVYVQSVFIVLSLVNGGSGRSQI